MPHRSFSRAAAFVLVLLLLAPFLSGTALAAPEEKTYTYDIYDLVWEEIYCPDGSWIDNVRIASGALPTGITTGWYQDYLYFQGIPTEAGTFTADISMEIGGGEYQYRVHFIIKDPNAPVTITKHPTGETTDEGGSAVFIARADNAAEIIWRLVSPDTATTYNCSEASQYFPGLEVLGLGTDTLILKNIPYSLNGWKAEAKFTGVGGPVFSNGALITVIRAKLSPPTITTQPAGGQVPAGQSVTLSVLAYAPEGSLRYQWYRAESDAGNGFAIAGANDSFLTLSAADGDGYYYVGVWCEDGDRSSEITLSDVAVLQFLAPAVTEAPAPSPAPATETPVQIPAPEPAGQAPAAPAAQDAPALQTVSQPRNDTTRTILLVGLGAASALLLVSVVALISRIRKNRQ